LAASAGVDGTVWRYIMGVAVSRYINASNELLNGTRLTRINHDRAKQRSNDASKTSSLDRTERWKVSMPKHIARLVLLIVAFIVIAVAAKSFFTKDSFYLYGHYRADSVPAIAGMATSFQTPKACVSCHAPRHAEWSGGNHKTVICEVCHGAAPGHPEKLKVVIPPDTLRLCSQCHEKMPGRPISSIRQVDLREHYPDAGQCIACHNPHAPKIGVAGAGVTGAGSDRKAAIDAAATCAACHGAKGISSNEAWPSLAGQNAAYIARSLGSFKSGARTNETMAPMAQTVDDANVAKLAAYFSSLPCRSAGSGHSKGNAAQGKIVAQQCVTCHGNGGRPVNTAWPSLTGQNPAYLEAALTAFKDGQRANVYMSPAAGALSPQDISNVAAYFAGLNCSARPQ
jgi:cytochrome c553